MSLPVLSWHFRFEPKVWDGFHDLMQQAISIDDAAIVSVKRSDWRINFWYVSKDEAINILNYGNLSQKKGNCKNIYKKYFLSMYKR